MKTRPWKSGVAGVGLLAALGTGPALAASHREAPLMTLDPGADISDVHFFVSYDQDNLSRAPADRALLTVSRCASQRSTSAA